MSEIYDALGQYLAALLHALLYPFRLILSTLANLINQILNPILNFFNGIYGIMSTVHTFLDTVLQVFPAEWRYIILALLGLMVALAVFAYIWN